MMEFKKTRLGDHPHLDLSHDFRDEEELEEKLDEIAYFIGKIIIEFNALESGIEYLIAEQLTHSGNQDDRTYVFLAEMMFQGKSKSLINLYGQIIENCSVSITQAELEQIRKRLEESAKIRNKYAHGHWQEMNTKGYVRVKTQASKKGIFQTYRLFDIEKMKLDIQYIQETNFLLDEFDDKIMDQLYERTS